MILSNTRKLAEPDSDGQRWKVYINPDEPVDIRRKHILERIRRKAVRENKNVSVSDSGVLTIDNVTVFSLEHGFSKH